MDNFKKFSIRVSENTCGLVEEFAKSNKISRNAAVELLLKLGIQSLQNSVVENERFDELDKKLKSVFRIILANQIIQGEAHIYADKYNDSDALKSLTNRAREKSVEKANQIFGEDKP